VAFYYILRLPQYKSERRESRKYLEEPNYRYLKWVPTRTTNDFKALLSGRRSHSPKFAETALMAHYGNEKKTRGTMFNMGILF